MNQPLTGINYPDAMPWPAGLELLLDCSEWRGRYKIRFEKNGTITVEPEGHRTITVESEGNIEEFEVPL